MIQQASILKTSITRSCFSLLVFAITACNDKEAPSVTLVNPASIPKTIDMDDASTTNNTNITTAELSLPNQPSPVNEVVETEPSVIAKNYPFNSLDLDTQLKELFGTDVITSTLFQTEDFYPLGWSKDGEKFAYASHHQITDTKANSMFDVYIQDLVSDKIIWQTPAEKTSDLAKNMNRWEQHKSSILSALKKNNITLSDNFSLQHAPIMLKKDTLSYKIKVSKATDPSLIKGYEIFLKSSLKGTKKVAKETFKISTKGTVGSKGQAHILGYLQGDNPSRIAILVGVLGYEWEGTNTVHYKIIGASLKAGKWR